METKTENDVMTFAATCEFLGIPKATLYDYTYRHVLPFYKPTKKRIYFLKSELTAWVTSNRIAPISEIAEEAHQVVKKMNKQ